MYNLKLNVMQMLHVKLMSPSSCKITKILVLNCALCKSSDAVLDYCAPTHTYPKQEAAH